MSKIIAMLKHSLGILSETEQAIYSDCRLKYIDTAIEELEKKECKAHIPMPWEVKWIPGEGPTPEDKVFKRCCMCDEIYEEVSSYARMG